MQVTGTFYDSAKTVVATSYTFTNISNLRPGEKSPYHMALLDTSQISKVASYKLSVASVAATAKPAYLKLILGDHFLDSLGYYHLVGEVTNQGTSTANYVQIAGAFYDANGKIVNTSYTFTKDNTDVTAGQTSPFELVVMENGSAIASSSINVDSSQYSMINNQLSGGTEPAQSTTPPPSPTPQESQQSQPSILKTGIETTLLTPLTFIDVQDNPMSSVSVDSMVLVSTTVKNNNPVSQPFTIVLDVRGGDGATVNIQVQKGTLNANGSADVAVSWIPQEKGTFQIRAFVVSSLKSPEILSALVTKSVVISE